MKKFYHVLTTGVLLLVVVFVIIIDNNNVLKKEDPSKDYMAYNWSKGDPSHIINYWKASPDRFSAVKNIVYLDYLLMAIYGFLIFYGLNVLRTEQVRPSVRKMLSAGMICIVVAVIFDAIQDFAIHQHVVNNNFIDLRPLTGWKFLLIIISVVHLINGILYRSKYKVIRTVK